MSDEKTKEPEALIMRPAQFKAVAAPRAFSLMPSTLGEAMEMAKLIADSDFAPKDYKGKAGNVMIAIQMGADVGLKPMQSLQNIAVINGRPAIWGDAALALCMDVLEDLPKETVAGDGDTRTATCAVKRKGMATAIVRSFSVADAKKAGLWTKQGPWQTYPDRMLAMRARGFALRDACADCLMGLVLVEEAQDYPPAGTIDVTPIGGNGQQAALPPAVAVLERLPDPVRENIEKAFEMLSLSPGARLTKLNEFLTVVEGRTLEDGATALLEWCRDEYAKRKTGQPRVKKSENGKTVHQAATASSAPSSPSGSEGAGSDVRPAGAEPPSGGSGQEAPPSSAPAADEIFKKPGQDSFVGF